MPPPPAVFHKISYSSDPYKTPIPVVTHGDSKGGIRQIHGGKVATFEKKFHRLFEGEPPKAKLDKKSLSSKESNKFLTTDGFKYTSNMKVSNNRGDYTATFTKKYEHIPITVPESVDGDGEQSPLRHAIKLTPRNFLTNSYKEEVFNKYPYITPMVDKKPEVKKKGEGKKLAPFIFRKKKDVFTSITYVEQGTGEELLSKKSTNKTLSAFRPTSTVINFRAPVTGTFSTIRYVPAKYDERSIRRARSLDKVLPLPPKTKDWIA